MTEIPCRKEKSPIPEITVDDRGPFGFPQFPGNRRTRAPYTMGNNGELVAAVDNHGNDAVFSARVQGLHTISIPIQ
jgi:hypothetical protein